jgi:hypothetical protein
MLRHKWWTAAVITIAFFGGMFGLGQRAQLTDSCTSKLAAAEAQRSSDANSAVASFRAAAVACEKTQQPEEQRRAMSAAQEITTQMAAKQAAERKAQYASALAEAKRYAATSGSEAQAVASYRRAAELGSLDADNSKQYARQLREHAKQLVASKDYAAAVSEFEDSNTRRSKHRRCGRAIGQYAQGESGCRHRQAGGRCYRRGEEQVRQR